MPPARQRPKPRLVQVRDISYLTPHMVRIRVGGDELSEFPTTGPAEHIKVFLPAPGQDRPVLPVQGPDGPEYPPDQDRPTIRTYTPRRYHPDTLELDIDFLLHGDGPASNWATRARVGDVIGVAGPRGAYQPDPAADWVLLAGDDTALPAIGTILEALPPSARAKVLVEVRDAAEEQPLESAARVDVRWLHRGEADGSAGRLLEDAVRREDLPDGDGRVWVACEAQVMRSIKRHLVDDRGLDRSALVTRGYWRYGEANHPDHDMGEDV